MDESKVDPGETTEQRVARLDAKRVRIVAILKALREGTLPIVEETGAITAKQLATRAGISEQLANNRLAALFKADVLVRQAESHGPPAGGHRYRYFNPPREP